jgi:flagellar hook-associated protein 1 FlgK
MSLTDLLNIGSQGLAASQMELNVTGQNVTNASTTGYSRKVVNLQAQVAQNATFGQLGSGVGVVGIQALRDAFLNQQMQGVSTQMGQQQQTDTSLQSIQNILTEPASSGLDSYMDQFWSAWQNLANAPADPTARQAVSDAGTALVDRFHSIGTQLDTMVSQQNSQITTVTAQVNQLLTGIAADNSTIAAANVGPGGAANDTVDDREQKMIQLSKLIDISYTTDAQGRYTVTSSGNLLVSPTGAYPLQVQNSTATLPDGSQTTQADLVLSSTHQPLVPQGGQLAALIQTRDQTIPQFQAQIDTLAKTLVQSVNAQHEQGYSLTGTTGNDFFDPAGTTGSTIDLAADIKQSVNNIAAAAGGTATSLGAPLNLAIPASGTAMDLTTTNPNYRNLSQGSVQVSTVGPPPVQLQEGAGKDYVVDYQSGQIYFNNPAVYPPGTALTVDFSYTTAGYNGQGDGNNAISIAQLAQASLAMPDATGTNMATLGGAYAAMVGGLGSAKTESASNLATTTNLQSYLQTQISSVSGVNMDEELANMVTFQNSYQASAKYISTVSTLMTTLINMT